MVSILEGSCTALISLENTKLNEVLDFLFILTLSISNHPQKNLDYSPFGNNGMFPESRQEVWNILQTFAE